MKQVDDYLSASLSVWRGGKTRGQIRSLLHKDLLCKDPTGFGRTFKKKKGKAKKREEKEHCIPTSHMQFTLFSEFSGRKILYKDPTGFGGHLVEGPSSPRSFYKDLLLQSSATFIDGEIEVAKRMGPWSALAFRWL